MTRTSDRCLDCGAETPGKFCASCGQRNTHYRLPLRDLVAEGIGEQLQLDARIARTLVPFLFRPGLLTREFLVGRRTRYTSPVRLYLFASLAYFVALSWIGPVTAQTADARPPPPPEERRELVERETEAFARFGELGLRLQRRLADLVARDEAEIASVLGAGIAERAPAAMFLLLPLFAVLTRVLFAGARLFYADHLVFALHFHAFAFAAQLLGLFGITGILVMAAIGTHLFAGLRRVFGESWPRTVWKGALLSAVYGVALSGAMLAMVILTIFLGA